MTISELVNNHIVYDAETDRPKIYDLAILNAAPGTECMKMCAIFDLPMSSAMMKNGPEEEYISFISNKMAASSYWIGDAYKPKIISKIIYYPEIEPILDEIFDSFPEFAEQMPGVLKKEFDSSELYKELGMEIIKEK